MVNGLPPGCVERDMNTTKVHPEDYVQFLLASPWQFTCTEAARVQPDPTAHDAFNRLLTRLEPDPQTLWREARPHIRPDDGILVLDDSTLDKPYARHMGLVGWHWSGKHHRAVKGINLLTLLWPDGDRHIPCDYRLYDKAHDGYSKNDLFAQQLRAAQQRGLHPKCVCFDSWYSSLDNLKLIRSLQWHWLTRLKANRKVRVDFGRPQAISTVDIPPQGRVVHLPGYGSIRVFRVVARNGDTDHWASSDLGMDALTRLKYGDFSWRIEEYHRGIKQFCGVEGCQARRVEAQRNHIGLSIRAFLRMECHCFALGLSWFQAKMDVIRHAVRIYLANPNMLLPKAA
jgi:putative transposase